MDVLVVGCGVNGLSCGVRLIEAGFTVSILTRDRTPNTTSDIAAAVYFPYRAYPLERVIGWGKVALEVFRALAADPASGVAMVENAELFDHEAGEPWWREMIPDYRRATAADLPPGCADGHVARVPVIEMPKYLAHLEQRFTRLGGRIETGIVGNLSELSPAHRIVVNCTGLGSRDLVHDAAMFPIRGQIVRVRNPGLTRCVELEADANSLTYVVPRSDCVVLGGTANDGDWSRYPRPEVEQGILERCTALVPALKGAEILSRAVGLRPGRNEVRLEAERLPGSLTVIHNYGHGGSGVTLSWGCAAEVVELVSSVSLRMAEA